MIDLFSNLSAGRVLDVATGRGGFIHFLLEHLKDFVEITGIDTQESAAAAFADAFPQPNIHFRCMDAAHLDFPDTTFDTVCIANSLHHLPDVHAVLSEMQRVLKPGGHFICLEMYRDGQDEAQQTHVLMHHWWAAVDMARGVCHHPTYTRQELLDLLDSLQLERVQIIDYAGDEGDPFDPEGITELNGIIDRYQTLAAELPSRLELQGQGEILRQRLAKCGFKGATSLVLLGRKAK